MVWSGLKIVIAKTEKHWNYGSNMSKANAKTGSSQALFLLRQHMSTRQFLFPPQSSICRQKMFLSLSSALQCSSLTSSFLPQSLVLILSMAVPDMQLQLKTVDVALRTTAGVAYDG